MTADHQKKTASPDVWTIEEDTAFPDNPVLTETLFALANGYFGTRGTLEEGSGDRPSCEGTYLNGVYYREEIPYGESAVGFASHNHKMVQVPNGKSIRLFLGDEEFLPATGTLDAHLRQLDMGRGLLTRQTEWTSPGGKKIRLESRRFVSLANRHLMAIDYKVTPLNFSGALEIISGLDSRQGLQDSSHDPRAGELSLTDSLDVIESGFNADGGYIRHRVRDGDREICSAFADIFTPATALPLGDIAQADLHSRRYRCPAVEGAPVTLTKYVTYGHKATADATNLVRQAQDILAEAARRGFATLLDDHGAVLADFWDTADVTIDGDPQQQQGLRFNLFHIFQSTGRDGRSNIGAKGLTGPGYDGHYFWDTEIYIIPCLLFTMPDIARSLLEYRYHILPEARRRARQMAHPRGALYAWRTIGGAECSAFFPAGTAQYHINAAVAYAIDQYDTVTEDHGFMADCGAEIIFETARIWPDLGRFSARHQGKFCLYEVTGPDEYTAMVDNNFYTNAMAQRHLEIAVKVATELATTDKAAFRALCAKISLTTAEIGLWAEIAEKMYLPHDETLGIDAQDDGFLDKPEWDFANVPKENYPLLLHYHPLVIYRHQVLKQADVMLAMFLLGERYSTDRKRRNFDYYEPRTTHDSTLSACIHSIISAEIGEEARAYDFLRETVRMDLDNNHHNTEYGVHTAAMAGSWMSVVNGFAGLRIASGSLSFAPFLPDRWTGYAFSVRYKGRKVRLAVEQGQASYELQAGPALAIRHFDQVINLAPARPVAAGLAAKPGISP